MEKAGYSKLGSVGQDIIFKKQSGTFKEAESEDGEDSY